MVSGKGKGKAKMAAAVEAGAGVELADDDLQAAAIKAASAIVRVEQAARRAEKEALGGSTLTPKYLEFGQADRKLEFDLLPYEFDAYRKRLPSKFNPSLISKARTIAAYAKSLGWDAEKLAKISIPKAMRAIAKFKEGKVETDLTPGMAVARIKATSKSLKAVADSVAKFGNDERSAMSELLKAASEEIDLSAMQKELHRLETLDEEEPQDEGAAE